jgi:hypothetical protein
MGVEAAARLQQLVGRLFAPSGSRIAVIKLIHLLRDPRLKMHVVGAMADGYLIFRHIRPQRALHPSRDLPVQLAHAVTRLRQPQGERGHTERLGVVVLNDLRPCGKLLTLLRKNTQWRAD